MMTLAVASAMASDGGLVALVQGAKVIPEIGAGSLRGLR